MSQKLLSVRKTYLNNNKACHQHFFLSKVSFRQYTVIVDTQFEQSHEKIKGLSLAVPEGVKLNIHTIPLFSLKKYTYRRHA